MADENNQLTAKKRPADGDEGRGPTRPFVITHDEQVRMIATGRHSEWRNYYDKPGALAASPLVRNPTTHRAAGHMSPDDHFQRPLLVFAATGMDPKRSPAVKEQALIYDTAYSSTMFHEAFETDGVFAIQGVWRTVGDREDKLAIERDAHSNKVQCCLGDTSMAYPTTYASRAWAVHRMARLVSRGHMHRRTVRTDADTTDEEEGGIEVFIFQIYGKRVECSHISNVAQAEAFARANALMAQQSINIVVNDVFWKDGKAYH